MLQPPTLWGATASGTATSARYSPLLSVGILSVDLPTYRMRRYEQRQTWVGEAHQMGESMYARFVLRCGNYAMSPSYPIPNYNKSASLILENDTHGDMICVSTDGELKYTHPHRLTPGS